MRLGNDYFKSLFFGTRFVHRTHMPWAFAVRSLSKAHAPERRKCLATALPRSWLLDDVIAHNIT